MNKQLIGAIVASILAVHCASRSTEARRLEAEFAEDSALDAAVPIPENVYRTSDSGVLPPIVIRTAHAEYTTQALKARVKGHVLLRAIVDRNGAVREVQILKPLEPSLDEAAIKAAGQWRFRPGMRNGEPVPVAVTVRMAFTTP